MKETATTYLLACIFGILCWPVLKIFARKTLRSKLVATTDKSRIYGLDHGVLNLEQPSTMWMNVGYWKDQMNDPCDFPRACKDLLEAVIQSAFRHRNEEMSVSRNIRLFDVGFGCGDQSLHLLQMGREPDTRTGGNGCQPHQPSVETYVGITNSQSQCSYARQRLQRAQTSTKMYKSSGSNDLKNFELFCEDAALPIKWSSNLKTSIEDMREKPSRLGDTSPTWLLALDTMYHFSPSRMPLLRYAHSELSASFMAFDYMLADEELAPSIIQRLLLRFICLLTSAPYGNFLTQKEYRQMLVRVGYRGEDIEIHDISECVFEPLSKFMVGKDTQLRSIGLGIGAFHVARWIFSWWGSSGIVRGCIVVARQESG